MKYFTILIIAICLIASGCCNNENFEVGGISVHYPKLDSAANLRSYILQPGSSHIIRDSVELGSLHAGNNYTLFVNFEFYREDQILHVVNTTYRDTVTNIYFERNYCKDGIKKFEYMLNGTYRTDRSVTISDPDQVTE